MGDRRFDFYDRLKMAVRNEWKATTSGAPLPPPAISQKADLKRWVRTNKIAEVFAALHQVAPDNNDLSQLESRHHHNEETMRQGTIARSDHDLESNRIDSALLDLIDELAED